MRILTVQIKERDGGWGGPEGGWGGGGTTFNLLSSGVSGWCPKRQSQYFRGKVCCIIPPVLYLAQESELASYCIAERENPQISSSVSRSHSILGADCRRQEA